MRLNKLIILILLLAISSCVSKKTLKPIAGDKKFAEALKDASPDFRQGWYDGCESSTASFSNSFYSAFYKNNKQDGYKMVNSPEYKTAWNAAYGYCARFESIHQKESIWQQIFGGYK